MNFINRKYIVDRKFQWTVVGYTFLISILTSAFHITISELFVIANIEQMTSVTILHVVGPKVAIGLLVVFFYVCVFAVSVLFSNRLAGALYRLRRHMSAVAKGEPLPPIHFRKNDYFLELNGAYNELLASVTREREDKASLD